MDKWLLVKATWSSDTASSVVGLEAAQRLDSKRGKIVPVLNKASFREDEQILNLGTDGQLHEPAALPSGKEPPASIG
jgi:hypothetical protein